MSSERFCKIISRIKEADFKKIGKVFAVIIGTVLIIVVLVGAFSSLCIYIYKFAVTSYKIADRYELFRDLLTVVLAIAGLAIAAGGYLAFRVLSINIQKQALSAAETEMLRSSASSFIHIGYNQWVLYKNKKNKIYLEQAIDATERAYKAYASKLNEHERENELIVCRIRNNLAYYYAEKQSPTDKKIARDYAKYIYERIQKFPEFREDWEDTYNFVQIKYP